MKLSLFFKTLMLACLPILPLAGCNTMRADEGGQFMKRTVLLEGKPHTYQVFVPAHRDSHQPTPIVLFLHGSGERGSDGKKQMEAGLGSYVRAHAAEFPALVVFPQAPKNQEWMGANLDMAMVALEAASDEFNGDPQRTYLTGLSMGGYGTWELALARPQRFAALVPICGAIKAPNDYRALYVTPIVDEPDPYAALAKRLRHLPVWIFHGAKDDSVSPEDDRRIFAAFKAAGADVQYTEFPEAGHNSWDATYRDDAMWKWLFQQHRQ